MLIFSKSKNNKTNKNLYFYFEAEYKNKKHPRSRWVFLKKIISGAGRKIRTFEGICRQIYSLLCLTASLSQLFNLY